MTVSCSREAELASNIRIRAPLRCDGSGRLDCAEDVNSGARMMVRWLPVEANGEAATEAVRRLPSHPTLPRVRQAGKTRATAFVAMDFPEGRLLSTMLDEPLSPGQLRQIGAEIADALATIHAQGVCHGELSADSLLLVPGNKALLWDMPLTLASRLTNSRGEERTMAQMVRVAPYLPPERAKGGPPSTTGDVYALGAILCLARSGQPAGKSGTLATLYEVATGRWAPEVPDSYPTEVQTLLRFMVHPDPVLRPTAREVADALSGASGSIPAVLKPEELTVPMRREDVPWSSERGSLLFERAPVEVPGRDGRRLFLLGCLCGAVLVLLAALSRQLFFGFESQAKAPVVQTPPPSEESDWVVPLPSPPR